MAQLSQPLQNLLSQAHVAVQAQQFAQAAEVLEQALAIDSDCLEAHLALAQIRFPGKSYTEVLSLIHESLQPATYVEIGVASGKSMVLARGDCRRVGIDPAPALKVALSPAVQIFQMTSGAFFADCRLDEILGGAPVALGFIDGMHLFENVLEDFVNLERFCAPDGTLLVHDCLPLNPIVASRKRHTRFWLGDVWRILPTLARFRPDLRLSVIACAPSGLAVIRGLNPTSRVLKSEFENALRYGAGVDFNVTTSLPSLGIEIVPSDWNVVSKLWRQ